MRKANKLEKAELYFRGVDNFSKQPKNGCFLLFLEVLTSIW